MIFALFASVDISALRNVKISGCLFKKMGMKKRKFSTPLMKLLDLGT